MEREEIIRLRLALIPQLGYTENDVSGEGGGNQSRMAFRPQLGETGNEVNGERGGHQNKIGNVTSIG